MSVQVRRRREAAAFLSTFVGAQGELLVDTTNNRVQVHDGATPGGWPAARLADLPSSASPLALNLGGTGSTTAASARSVLVAAASGANADITSLSGLTTALSLAQGGTGATTGAGARSNLAAAASGSNSDITGLSALATPLSVPQGGTGATTGGAAALALGITTRTAVVDATYNALPTDRTIAYTALTGARIVNLPAAGAYPTGTQLVVVDESGSCGATKSITIDAAGSDLINGSGVAVLSLSYGYLAIESNGIGRWTIVDQSTASLAQQTAAAVAITGGSIDATVVGGATPAGGSFTTVAASGTIATPGELRGGGGSALRAVGTSYGVILRNDDASFYLLATAAGSPLGAFGSIRPFSFLLSSGLVTLGNGATVNGTLTAANVAITGGALNATTVGATTAATVRGTTVAATTSVNLPTYTVTSLPVAGTIGRVVFCSNARMQTSTAGSLEASGAGTGGIVSDNGTAWKIAGTNISVSA